MFFCRRVNKLDIYGICKCTILVRVTSRNKQLLSWSFEKWISSVRDVSAGKFVSHIRLLSLATWANMIWLTHAIFHCPKRLLSFFCYPGPHTAIWHLTYLCLNFKSSLSLCLAWCSIQSPLSGGFTSYFLLPQFKKLLPLQNHIYKRHSSFRRFFLKRFISSRPGMAKKNLKFCWAVHILCIKYNSERRAVKRFIGLHKHTSYLRNLREGQFFFVEDGQIICIKP